MRSTLKSLAVSLPPVDQWTSHSPSDLWPHDPLRPVFPSLQAFEFNYLYERGPLGLLFERFTEHMLKRHAYQLKHLVFPAWITSDYFGVLVSSAIHFPNLESITIRSSALTMTIASQMPNLKSLTFPTFEPVTPSIPPHSFPSLRRFSGSCRCFSDILTRERPITHVQFDGAVFDMEDASIFAEGAQPTWSDVFDAIKQFPMSSGPVHHLSFYVSSINLSALRKTLPYVRSLKSIVICLRSNPKDINKQHSAHERFSQLGTCFLSRLPHLRSFLLSDEPKYAYRGKRFSHSRDEKMQRAVLRGYEASCPGLTQVAFTGTCVWEKTAPGEWTRKRHPRLL
ncbi:hypothetical protein NLI96_g629 [Meripilus lineatus]|uniref:Uncharacterized protein n=1 Tax=Meripilus lineatus TaxID=2056292 RepID=A0AAD5VBQ5_9APHY|nr:hypothetical protein NLI96_g629 [Physisporinus lineatus]